MRSVCLVFFDASVCTVVSDITIIVGSFVRKVHAPDTAIAITACFYAQLLCCLIDFFSKGIAKVKEVFVEPWSFQDFDGGEGC